MNIIKIIFTITMCVEIAASILVTIGLCACIKDETDKKIKVLLTCAASLFSLAPITQLCMYIYYFLGVIYEIFLK